jgi:hypothetical protein
MEPLKFEAIKVALKQDKTGYVLTLCMHPDEIPEPLLRDFVGARYQVVMVRLNEHEMPMDRRDLDKSVVAAGILSRDEEFWAYLADGGHILEPDEKEATEWLRDYLGVISRSELKTNEHAKKKLNQIQEDFFQWKQKS